MTNNTRYPLRYHSQILRAGSVTTCVETSAWKLSYKSLLENVQGESNSWYRFGGLAEWVLALGHVGVLSLYKVRSRWSAAKKRIGAKRRAKPKRLCKKGKEQGRAGRAMCRTAFSARLKETRHRLSGGRLRFVSSDARYLRRERCRCAFVCHHTINCARTV